MPLYECWIKSNKTPLKPKDKELFFAIFNVLPDENYFYRYFLLVLTKKIETDGNETTIYTLNGSVQILDENNNQIIDEDVRQVAINKKENILEFLRNFNNVFDNHEIIVNNFTADDITELNEKSILMKLIRENQFD
jgi:hypothetical protein